MESTNTADTSSGFYSRKKGCGATVLWIVDGGRSLLAGWKVNAKVSLA